MAPDKRPHGESLDKSAVLGLASQANEFINIGTRENARNTLEFFGPQHRLEGCVKANIDFQVSTILPSDGVGRP